MSDGPHVLVIDDELQIRRFLRISLEANGYTVSETATSSGDQGTVEAILGDEALRDDEKQAMLALYKTFINRH